MTAPRTAGEGRSRSVIETSALLECIAWAGAFGLGVSLQLSGHIISAVLALTYTVLSLYCVALQRRVRALVLERAGYRDAYHRSEELRTAANVERSILAGDPTLMRRLVEIARETGADIELIPLDDLDALEITGES